MAYYTTITNPKSRDLENIFKKGVFGIMNINIETDIDANIKKLDELIEKLELAEQTSKSLTFITISQFAEMRQCSLQVAQRIFNEKSFPSENYAKQKVVEISALKHWYMQKRDKNDRGI